MRDQPALGSVVSLDAVVSKVSGEATANEQDMISRVLREYYRCSDFSGQENVALSQCDHSPRAGASTCQWSKYDEFLRPYVELSSPSRAHDTLMAPFDAGRVIDDLRLERYWSAPLRGYEKFLKDVYYLLRPLTNQFLRRRVQKFRTRNWRQQAFPHWPVDTTVEEICEGLLLLAMESHGVDRVPFIWFWPDGARGCVTMTHDVEMEEGRDFCDELMDLDDSFGIKASFQIVPESRYSVPATFLDRVRQRGFEIGIQDLNQDGKLFDNRAEFFRRAQKINRYGREYGARGFRAGVLYRNPDWYNALDFSFDMSMPNVAHLDPQRGGCCTVTPYFIGDLLEIPVTTIQDYTLFRLLGDYSIDLWTKQTETILKKNGLVSFIVHPDYVKERRPNSVYRELLGYLRHVRENEDVWFAVPPAIDHWWRARAKMAIVPAGDYFRIEGEGAERAMLAFARPVNGGLKYEIQQLTH